MCLRSTATAHMGGLLYGHEDDERPPVAALACDRFHLVPGLEWEHAH